MVRDDRNVEEGDPSTILVYNEIGRATSDTYIRGVGFLGNYKLRFQ